VTEMTRFSACLAKVASLSRRSAKFVPNRLRPTIVVICSGSKVFRMNPVVFSLWLLFPFSLILTSDWIGLLVVFQAMTAAVRLRKTAAAETLAAFSSMSAAPGNCKGE